MSDVAVLDRHVRHFKGVAETVSAFRTQSIVTFSGPPLEVSGRSIDISIAPMSILGWT
jgi:hypothetical protein